MKQEFPNVEVRAFPRKVYRELRKATDKTLDEIAGQGDESTQEILKSIRDYQAKARLWTRFSDQAYLNSAF